MAIIITADIDGVDALLERMGSSPGLTRVISKVVSRYAREAQAEAVRNLSNRAVSYNGEVFIIKRQTGKLARSIRITSMTALSASIQAGDAEVDYAAAVEHGHKAFDMKPFLRGKLIPIRVKGPTGNRKPAMGALPFPVVGNSNKDPMTTRASKVQKFASTGKANGSEYLIFRRVTATSTGWIIPPQPPRPFMAAAGAAIQKPFSEGLQKAVKDYWEGVE